jgi:hypothetical protein
LRWFYLSSCHIIATSDVGNLEIFWKVNLVQTVIIYENKSGLQMVESVDTQVKPYQSAIYSGI